MPTPAVTDPGPPMLRGFLRAHRRAVVVVLALSTLESLPALLSGLLLARALDHGFLAGRLFVGLAWLGALGTVMVLRAAVTRELIPRLGAIVEPLRDALVTSVVAETLRRAVTDTAPPDGAGVARLTRQVETVRSLVSALLRSARQLGLSLVMALVGLATLAPAVAFLAAGPLALALAAAVPLLRALGRRQQALVVAEEAIARETGDLLTGLRDLVACGARDRGYRQLDGLIADARSAARGVAGISALIGLAVSVGGKLPALAVLLAAPGLSADHGLTTGALVGAVTYLLTTVDPAVRSLVEVLGSWGVELAAVLRRLAQAGMLSPPAADLGGSPAPAAGDRPSLGHGLVIDSVTFAYGPHADPVIRGLTLDIPEGARLAVVGASGIGKSTLVELLAGLVVPDSGEIRLGTAPLHTLDPSALRHTVRLLPQEGYVFTGTLRDNLRYLRQDASDSELARSAAAVGMDGLIERLGGVEARIGAGGHTLSAGERQLVALVRAHVCTARVILLDEATCHLDPSAERRAEAAFAQRGGTVVVVAHRISSALRADRILLMDGDRTAAGTHAELLATSPHYADLVGHWNGSPSTTPTDG
ncbi:ATP-binding cassette domain-containing protein [Kitasatospora sp. NPDC088346]|uniref:ATP-binding cassette domain-containing protein n=1 Tax=Kitasatospora sp. NPDC088346 TaxID=3364073 RepID=UPI0038004BC8